MARTGSDELGGERERTSYAPPWPDLAEVLEVADLRVVRDCVDRQLTR